MQCIVNASWYRINRIDEMIIVIEKNRDTSVDHKLLQKPCKSTGYKEWIPEEI